MDGRREMPTKVEKTNSQPSYSQTGAKVGSVTKLAALYVHNAKKADDSSKRSSCQHDDQGTPSGICSPTLRKVGSINKLIAAFGRSNTDGTMMDESHIPTMKRKPNQIASDGRSRSEGEMSEIHLVECGARGFPKQGLLLTDESHKESFTPPDRHDAPQETIAGNEGYQNNARSIETHTPPRASTATRENAQTVEKGNLTAKVKVQPDVKEEQHRNNGNTDECTTIKSKCHKLNGDLSGQKEARKSSMTICSKLASRVGSSDSDLDLKNGALPTNGFSEQICETYPFAQTEISKEGHVVAIPEEMPGTTRSLEKKSTSHATQLVEHENLPPGEVGSALPDKEPAFRTLVHTKTKTENNPEDVQIQEEITRKTANETQRKELDNEQGREGRDKLRLDQPISSEVEPMPYSYLGRKDDPLSVSVNSRNNAQSHVGVHDKSIEIFSAKSEKCEKSNLNHPSPSSPTRGARMSSLSKAAGGAINDIPVHEIPSDLCRHTPASPNRVEHITKLIAAFGSSKREQRSTEERPNTVPNKDVSAVQRSTQSESIAKEFVDKQFTVSRGNDGETVDKNAMIEGEAYDRSQRVGQAKDGKVGQINKSSGKETRSGMCEIRSESGEHVSDSHATVTVFSQALHESKPKLQGDIVRVTKPHCTKKETITTGVQVECLVKERTIDDPEDVEFEKATSRKDKHNETNCRQFVACEEDEVLIANLSQHSRIPPKEDTDVLNSPTLERETFSTESAASTPCQEKLQTNKEGCQACTTATAEPLTEEPNTDDRWTNECFVCKAHSKTLLKEFSNLKEKLVRVEEGNAAVEAQSKSKILELIKEVEQHRDELERVQENFTKTKCMLSFLSEDNSAAKGVLKATEERLRTAQSENSSLTQELQNTREELKQEREKVHHMINKNEALAKKNAELANNLADVDFSNNISPKQLIEALVQYDGMEARECRYSSPQAILSDITIEPFLFSNHLSEISITPTQFASFPVECSPSCKTTFLGEGGLRYTPSDKRYICSLDGAQIFVQSHLSDGLIQMTNSSATKTPMKTIDIEKKEANCSTPASDLSNDSPSRDLPKSIDLRMTLVLGSQETIPLGNAKLVKSCDNVGTKVDFSSQEQKAEVMENDDAAFTHQCIFVLNDEEYYVEPIELAEIESSGTANESTCNIRYDKGIDGSGNLNILSTVIDAWSTSSILSPKENTHESFCDGIIAVGGEDESFDENAKEFHRSSPLRTAHVGEVSDTADTPLLHNGHQHRKARRLSPVVKGFSNERDGVDLDVTFGGEGRTPFETDTNELTQGPSFVPMQKQSQLNTVKNNLRREAPRFQETETTLTDSSFLSYDETYASFLSSESESDRKLGLSVFLNLFGNCGSPRAQDISHYQSEANDHLNTRTASKPFSLDSSTLLDISADANNSFH